MESVHTIAIPTRPQPDTVVAVFLLKKFGNTLFPGIATSKVEIRSLPEKKTTAEYLRDGVFPLDIGGGMFDHHGKKECATELVAQCLNLTANPMVTKLIAYAVRDDKYGKGILSTDPIDRAFGLSGLIAALNKTRLGEAQSIMDTVYPLLEAHHGAAHEHHVEIPTEIQRKRMSGQFHETFVYQGGGRVKITFVVSDKASMATYLRNGEKAADVVVQKTETTGHVCVLTRNAQTINLSTLAALLRVREAEHTATELPDDIEYLKRHGRIDEVPVWFYDPATNSMLNGGLHALHITPTRIEWNELQQIVRYAIEETSP